MPLLIILHAALQLCYVTIIFLAYQFKMSTGFRIENVLTWSAHIWHNYTLCSHSGEILFTLSIPVVSLHFRYDSISDYSMYGFPSVTVMVLLLDDLCTMTTNISNLNLPFLGTFGVSFPMSVHVDTLLSEIITFFWGLAPAPFLLPSSRQNSSDL